MFNIPLVVAIPLIAEFLIAETHPKRAIL